MAKNKVKVEITIDEDGKARNVLREVHEQLRGVTAGGVEAGEKTSMALSVFKGQFLYDFFRRGADAALSFGKQAVAAFNEVKSAQLGLASEAKYRGITGDVGQTIRDLDLVKGGLLSISDAGSTVKNFLASGFNLEQSVTMLNRFGDSAAFNRQQSLSFGEAVKSASEGIKNQNSILVDNAGITKNISVILKERGFAMEDLSDKIKGAAAREALYQGLLQETQGQLGNAGKLMGEFAGQTARLDASEKRLLASTGEVIAQSPKLAAGIGEVARQYDLLSSDATKAGTATNNMLKGAGDTAGEVATSVANILASVKGLVDLYGKVKSDNPGGAGALLNTLDNTFNPLTLARHAAGFDEVDKGNAALQKEIELTRQWSAAHGARLELMKKESTERAKSTDALAMLNNEEKRAQALALITIKGSLSETQSGMLHKLFDQMDESSRTKVLDDAKKQTEELLKSEHEARQQITQMGAELRHDNPLARAMDEAAERAERFEQRFSDVSDSVKENFRSINDELRSLELFKGALSLAGGLNDTILQRDQLALSGGRARAQSEGQERTAFLQRQMDVEIERRGLMGEPVSDTDAARRRVAEYQSRLFGRFQAEAVEQATRGLSRDQLMSSGLLNARLGALDDLGRAGRDDYDRQQQLRQIEDQSRDRAIQIANAALAAAQSPEARKAALDFALNQTSNVGALTTDQAAARVRFLDQSLGVQTEVIKRQAQQDAERQAGEKEFVAGLREFVKALEKGFGINVNVATDSQATARVDLGEGFIQGGATSPYSGGDFINIGGGASNNY